MICGIDVGTLSSPATVAWLREQEFFLDIYIPTSLKPLPEFPAWVQGRTFLAFDAPQGLPAKGQKIRGADRAASTPTKRLPENRRELARWKAYQGLIEAGIEIFWSIHANKMANVYGLETVPGLRIYAAETYPRYTIRKWWPDLTKIPSKRKAPLEYVDTLWSRIQKLGYSCPSVIRPTVDQVDAMLCALAASSLTWCTRKEPAGNAPIIDANDRILREGFIV